MFDLRSFSLDDMYRCSADLRSIGETARDTDDVARKVASYFFDLFRDPETGAHQLSLVRLFRTQPLSSIPPDEATRAYDDGINGGTTVCLTLRASRGARPEWNDPAASRAHRLIPLASAALARMPMVSGLVAHLGVPAGLISGGPFELTDPLALFDVFHVEQARGSPLVPDQADFVAPYGIESVVGFGGVLPPSEVFVVVLFANVRIPRVTADLFRTLAASVGIALRTPPGDRSSLEYRVRACERIVRHHEQVALEYHQQCRRFEALVENCSDLIAIADPDGRGRYINPAGRRMMGLSPTFDVTTMTLGDLCASDVRQDAASPPAPKGACWNGEGELRNRQTNAAIPVSIHSFAIRESGTDRVLGLGTVMRDITEKRRDEDERERLLASALEAKAEAQRASQAKDDFLASLGHELRNPLSPILTAAELMRLRGPPSREQEIIARQAVHLARLVDDLLDVARISRGKIEISKKPVEIATIVARGVEIAGPSLQQKRQRLVVDVPPRDLVVAADSGRMAQVVSNLLDNASKYGPEGSEVTITARRSGDRLRLSVRDRGIGMPSEILETIFEPFAQHREPGARAAPGLGLGLSIVRGVVELHGGVVRARSEGPGKGSELVLEMPLVERAVTAARPPAVNSGAPARPPGVVEERKRVLLVDDNEDAASVLAEALEEVGHEVVVASNGPTALERARELEPDVALLDIGMPGMDGYELARRLRDLHLPHDMTLVAVTGYGQEDDRRKSVEAGFTAHLVKPIALGELLSIVGAPR